MRLEDINQGKRSAIMRLHNNGHCSEVIAQRVNIPAEAIHAYITQHLDALSADVDKINRRRKRRNEKRRHYGYIKTEDLPGTPPLAPTPVLDLINEKYGDFDGAI